MNYKFLRIYLSVLTLFLISATVKGELLMRTQGHVYIAPYLHGVDKTAELYPGYRAEFLATVDILQFDRLFVTGIVGNETVINRSDSILVKLDRIHYTVSPGFRYEFKDWMIRGSFHHESINRIDKEEQLGGAFWQNSLRLGLGSKGSSYLYLEEEYRNRNNVWLNSVDIQLTGGIFLRGSESIWVAKNHNYRYEVLARLRHHLGIYQNWTFFYTLDQHLWINANDSVEKQYRITFNVFRKGAVNFFGIFYTYVILDTNSQDNEDRTGSLGLKVVF